MKIELECGMRRLLICPPDPPGPPRILGLSPGDQLAAGALKRATCTSLAGNPLAKLEWFIGDRKLESRYFTRYKS